MMLRLRSMLILAAVSAAFASGALAQDAQANRWTGFYIGAHGGGGEGRIEGASLDLTGALAGGHIGYNWQGSKAVFGIEADLSWSDYDSSASLSQGGFTASAGASQDFLTSVRARLGFAEGPLLLYGTFGIAYTEVDASISVTGPGINISDKETAELSGIIGGAGLEYALGSNVSLRGEALWFEVHPDFDFSTAGYEGSVYRAGISYHFR